MSLTFILILLLVFGLVFANIALLRYGNKPMQVKTKKPVPAADTAAAPGKTQAATTSAIPFTTGSNEPAKNPLEHNNNSSASDSNDSGSSGD